MEALLYSIFATLVVSLISFIGILPMVMSEKFLGSITKILIAFAAGGLLGGAFFHLIPEGVESTGELAFALVTIGFVVFFIFERILCWRHCHNEKCHIHPFTYLNLMGDAIHNFTDGLIISASFLTDVSLGITTTIAVIMHEIPQEIGDFAVLVYGGMTRLRALFFNFLTALTAILGAFVGYFLSTWVEGFTSYVLPIAAGGFLYIGACDLIPELHQETSFGKSIVCIAAFLFGLVMMWGLTLI